MADRFDTTRWSVVLRAGDDGDEARNALAVLCETYRPPVLAYVRAHVRDRVEAEDLTQSFFAHLIGGRIAARADRTRGRFRAFLLTSLKNFLSNERERARALRRGGGAPQVSVDDVEAVADAASDPEQMFEQEWARTVLQEALRRLEREAELGGRATQFAHLRPFLVEPPGDAEYESLAQALGLRRNTLAVAVHRLRTRLQAVVREVVADTVGEPGEVDVEVRRMRTVLSATEAPGQ